jgi:hypothetical protein
MHASVPHDITIQCWLACEVLLLLRIIIRLRCDCHIIHNGLLAPPAHIYAATATFCFILLPMSRVGCAMLSSSSVGTTREPVCCNCHLNPQQLWFAHTNCTQARPQKHYAGNGCGSCSEDSSCCSHRTMQSMAFMLRPQPSA